MCSTCDVGGVRVCGSCVRVHGRSCVDVCVCLCVCVCVCVWCRVSKWSGRLSFVLCRVVSCRVVSCDAGGAVVV